MGILSVIGIQDALAAAAPQAQAAPSLMSFMPMMIIIGLGFYFMIFRPQSKQAKQQKSMLADLAIGDEVLTAGGILGKITKVKDDFVRLTIADSAEISLKKSSIASVLPKGTAKSIS